MSWRLTKETGANQYGSIHALWLKKSLRGCLVLVSLVSAALAASVVLDYHIEITESAYSGTIETSYISPYTVLDIAAFAAIGFASWVLLGSLVMRARSVDTYNPDLRRIPAREVYEARWSFLSCGSRTSFFIGRGLFSSILLIHLSRLRACKAGITIIPPHILRSLAYA